MQILQKGDPWSAKVTCPSCHAVLLVEQKDVYRLYKDVPATWIGSAVTSYKQEFTVWACDCPECRTRIRIGPELKKSTAITARTTTRKKTTKKAAKEHIDTQPNRKKRAAKKGKRR